MKITKQRLKEIIAEELTKAEKSRKKELEKEAYNNDHNFNYLDNRQKFAWRKYKV